MTGPDDRPTNLAEALSEENLILKLRSAEHDFVERKPIGQKGDWLQTAVAFANSTPIGWPAVLFIGVDDSGKPQRQGKLEDLEKQINGILEHAYPPIYRHIVPLHLPEGDCLAVIIPGSPSRPHFAGRSYVRLGAETREASEQAFGRLIAQRSSKAGELLRWLDKEITFRFLTLSGGNRTARINDKAYRVIGCNDFYVTLANPSSTTPQSYSLSRIELAFDDQNGRLLLEYT